MKILIIMGGFFPGQNYGGPPVSINNFCSLLEDEDIYIICKDHDLGEKKRYKSINPGWNDRGNCKVFYLSDKDYSYSNLNKITEELNPDLIYLQSLFSKSTLLGLKIAQNNNKKVLLAPRGELNDGAFKKTYKKVPYIYYLKCRGLLKGVMFQGTSKEEILSIKKHLRIHGDKIYELPNIPSLPNKEYSKEEKYPGKGKFVFVSRIHPKKNLLSAIRFFKNIEGNIEFDIYGPIEDFQYWDSCKEEISKLQSNIEVNYCGIISHTDVHNVFSKYDAFVFPTLSENYGHVIAEALSVGTTVIISDQTPWNEINIKGVGHAIPLNQKDAFSKAIQEIVDMDDKDIEILNEKAVQYIREKNKNNELRNKYKNCFVSILKDDK